MTNAIDLNADLGESFGAWTMGADNELLDIVTSANVACGFHAGDPLVMTETVRSCLDKGVNIGAHPGFDDITGFGRRRLDMASESDRLASVCLAAVQRVDEKLSIVAMAATCLQAQAEDLKMPLLREVFADRAYNDDGTLVSRGTPGAVIHDPVVAAERVLKMIETQSVESINGVSVKLVPDTVCVHGDNPEAVRMAEALRTRIEKAGISVRGYS